MQSDFNSHPKRRMQMSTKRNNASIVGGSILILFGLLALFGQLFRGFDFWGRLWPFIIIGFGALFFVGMFLGGKSVAGLAIPGSIITVIGLMMLVQSLTGYWESWSYSWTVILISVGLGIFIMGLWTGSESERRSGLRIMEIGAILLIVFGSFFELIFSAGRGRTLGGFVFPGLLVLLGIYLIVARSGILGPRSQERLDQPDDQAKGQ
jgi:hypothetical protein